MLERISQILYNLSVSVSAGRLCGVESSGPKCTKRGNGTGF